MLNIENKVGVVLLHTSTFWRSWPAIYHNYKYAIYRASLRDFQCDKML